MFSKKDRITSKDFDRIFKNGKFYSDANIAAKIFSNKLNKNRFAFSVGKKYSPKAVSRNKIKRQLQSASYEIAKENNLTQGFDTIIFISKAPKNELSYEEIKKQLFNIFKKSNVL